MKPSSLLLVVLLTCALLGGSFLVQAPAPKEELRALVAPPPGARAETAWVSGASVHGKRGVYITAYAAAHPGILSEVLRESRRFGLNAVVVDIKNNHGEVCYPSRVPTAHALGAVRPLLDLPKLVEELHKNGLYVIARQVVFYDPLLAKHLGVGTDPWVLPMVETAVAYNLAIAQEAEGLGVDEIQFDYIRFPDDGPIGPDYSRRCQAVEAFLARAQAALSVPISADVYGRVLWPWNAQRIDPIGQHLESIARHVDVISPMLYPSHFVEAELKADPYGTIFRTMSHGKARVQAPLRPYLQAFSMALPGGMTLAEYIIAQIRAAEATGADGCLFWNPRSDYTALWQALTLLAGRGEGM